jgi:hypothetical protein
LVEEMVVVGMVEVVDLGFDYAVGERVALG